jgi:hypothetical protein
MGELAQVEIERDVADAAARRAAAEGVTVTAYISTLLRRTFERPPSENSVLEHFPTILNPSLRAKRSNPERLAQASGLLRRPFGAPRNDAADAVPSGNTLVYDHVEEGGELHVDRDSNEEDENHHRRSDLYNSLFSRRN